MYNTVLHTTNCSLQCSTAGQQRWATVSINKFNNLVFNLFLKLLNFHQYAEFIKISFKCIFNTLLDA